MASASAGAAGAGTSQQPPTRLTLEPVVSKLEKFILYETHSFLYIVGCDKRQREYRVIKLDRKVSQLTSALVSERLRMMMIESEGRTSFEVGRDSVRGWLHVLKVSGLEILDDLP